MQKFISESLINELEAQTESILNKAIQWQMVADEAFSKQPGENQWSAKQCLKHLNSYGNYYLPAIEKAIHKDDSKSNNSFTPGWLGNYFTKLMQLKDGGVKKKMKSPNDHAYDNEGNAAEVIAEFIDQQEKILQLLHKARRVNLNKIKVPISIAPFIKLRLGDTFRFMIAHNTRHISQAEKALTSCKHI